jgi:hypothetical protein
MVFFFLIWSCAWVFLLLAGHGGEGVEKLRVLSFGAGGRRGGQLVLQSRDYYTVASFAAVICGRCGGISMRQVSTLLQPPAWRPLSETLVGVHHLLVLKWCVPDGVKVAGGGDSKSVARTKGSIAFSYFVLGSCVQISRTVMYPLSFTKVLCVRCIPPTIL